MENVNWNVLNYIVKDINLSVARLGINTKLSVEVEKEYKKEYVKVYSTPFQTMPMIFKSIMLDGSIYFNEDKDDKDSIKINVRLDYRYQTFGDGSNGHRLGDFHYSVEKHCWEKWEGSDNSFIDYEIRKVQGLTI